ncbi:hypothetical protein PG913_03680 [Tenacibaculum pacificus]|uniref:hypothetical protein n=1 Tax=Tenacibaculum TaxID=104267 RepID=UPI0022F39DF8|nr:hypothetical protein [Tenacibaculum pacificus]WBX74316.1 hypothetical protein PG913_03680 [Tenacibaculum pacificus]
MDNIGEKANKFFKSKPIEDIDANVDSKSTKEDASLFIGEIQSIQEHIQHEEHIIKKLDKTSERFLREKNAKLAFIFSSVWAIFIAIVILLKGFGFFGFKLSETEFLFVVGALTTSIFTFYLLVLKFLFDKQSIS